jgi:hypothetical protein
MSMRRLAALADMAERCGCSIDDLVGQAIDEFIDRDPRSRRERAHSNSEKACVMMREIGVSLALPQRPDR